VTCERSSSFLQMIEPIIDRPFGQWQPLPDSRGSVSNSFKYRMYLHCRMRLKHRSLTVAAPFGAFDFAGAFDSTNTPETEPRPLGSGA
jgi:hypothetical protein